MPKYAKILLIVFGLLLLLVLCHSTSDAKTIVLKKTPATSKLLDMALADIVGLIRSPIPPHPASNYTMEQMEKFVEEGKVLRVADIDQRLAQSHLRITDIDLQRLLESKGWTVIRIGYWRYAYPSTYKLPDKHVDSDIDSDTDSEVHDES